MFARVTQLEIDIMRTSVDDALERFDAEVLPELRRAARATRAATCWRTRRGTASS